MKTYTPHNYQKAAIQFAEATPRSALFLDMGLGKTSVTLTAIRNMLARGEVSRVLVIAPKRVAEQTWTAEVAKWSHTTGIVCSVCVGTAAEVEAGLDRPAHVYLINRERVKWLCERFPKKWPFDFVVIDESSSFKDQGSQRFKALRKVARKFPRLLLLTGTPSPNSYLDLWAQFYLIDPAILGPTFGGYRDAYFSPDRRSRDRVFSYKIDPNAAAIIEAKIAPYAMSLRAADYLDLPPKLDNVVRVAMSPAGRRAYDTLERDAVLQIVAEGGLVVGTNAAALTGKLAQAANGAVYDESRDVHHLHDDKLDALEEIIDTATGPVLIAYAYKHDLARLRARFPTLVEIGDAMDTVERFNAGTIELFAGHPASMGHGLNLQGASSTIVWFGLTWSNELHAQFNARLHRQGQTRPVIVNYLLADGTVDEDIFAALGDKHASQEVLLNALRRRIEGHTAGKAAA